MLLPHLIPIIFGSMVSGDYVPICQRGDPNMSTCILNFLIYLKPYVKEGIPDIGFPSFDPLVLNDITIKHSSVDGNFTWTVNNLIIHYLYDYELISVRQNGETISVDFKFEKLFATMAYTSVGEFLNTPMNGEGNSTEWYGPIYITVEIKHNIVGNNELEFCNIADIKFHFDIKTMYVSIRGLKEREEEVNQMFNHASEETINVLNKLYDSLFEVLTKKIFINICKHIPYVKLLPKKSI